MFTLNDGSTFYTTYLYLIFNVRTYDIRYIRNILRVCVKMLHNSSSQYNI